MKPRGLSIAVLILCILAGVLYWSEHHKPAEEGAKLSANVSPAILKLDEADITRLTIKKSGAEPLTLVKGSAGNWQITGPRTLSADQNAVANVLSTLSPLSSDRVVENKAVNLQQYGLDQPAVEVDIAGKDKTQRLLIGDDTPTGEAAYAMLAGDPRVFTTPSFNKTSLDKGLNDLRDTRLLTIDSSKVTRVELIGKAEDIAFSHNENGWRILKPRPLRADNFEVEELVRKLTDARMDFSGPGSKDIAAAYARATPLATAKLTGESGTQMLQVRKSKDDYYAKSSAVEGVYKVDSDLGQAVGEKLDDFRNKKLFDFSFDDPNKLELHSGAKAYLFTRSGQDWWSNGKKMDAGSVESLVSTLRDLTANKFVDTGFSRPEVEVRVTSDNGRRVEKVSISKADSDCVAKRENEPSLYQLDASVIDDLQKEAGEIKPAATSSR